MCVHEIWIYSECRCQVDHLIPCLNALAGEEPPRNPSPLGRRRKKASLCGIRSPSPLRIVTKHGANTSPVHLPPSPSPTDSDFSSHLEDYYRRPERSQIRDCSVNHTVKKAFLEPICDDCLLQELGVEKPRSGYPPDVSATAGDGLIWGSDIKIEVSEPHPTSPQRDILESNVEVLTKQTINDTLPALKYQNGPIGHTRQASTLSATDADDEGSLRGRAPTRIKQQRRKGIDITREQLRTSSRLAAWDKHVSGNVRDDIQSLKIERGEHREHREQSPSKSFLARFREAESGSKSWVRGVVGNLRRSLSRNSRQSKQGKPGGCQDAPAASTPQLTTSSVCTLRAVASDASSTSEEHRDIIPEVEEACPGPDVPFSKSESDSVSSWKAHLSHDIVNQQQKSKQIISSSSTSRLQLTTSSEHRTPRGPDWFARSESSEFLPLRSISERDSRSDILSMTSTAPPVPDTASSTWSGLPTGQRLASIISNSEFDAFTEHPWSTRLEPMSQDNDHEIDATTINDDDNRSSAPSSHRYATSIDTKTSIHTADPASPPRPVRPRPPPQYQHVHTDTPRPTKGLAIHPLQTPLRIAAPLRPAFTPRTSSLSSPPLSTPARLGGHMAINHSPTAHFVCVWERHLCISGCGKVVGEEVRSCVCDNVGGERVGCKSTGPVVRYLKSGDGEVCGECTRDQSRHGAERGAEGTGGVQGGR